MISFDSRVLERPAGRSLAPTVAVRSPHARGALVALGLAAGIGLASCTTGDSQTTPPLVLGMTNTIAPYYSDQQLTMYQVQLPVELPMRRPTEAERANLGNAAPYPNGPFLHASDVNIEVHWTITNIDDQEHKVELLFDPWNEFVRYRPGVEVVNDEETTPNFSGYDKLMPVPGKSRVEGNLTADDTREMAVDLATAMNIMSQPADPTATFSQGALMNRAFNIQNRSNDGDPILTPLIPSIVAGLTGWDLGLRTYENANLAIEISIDVTDVNGNRVLPPDSTDKPMGVPPGVLSPPAARMGM
jgi:hypothetical protein